MRGVIPKDLEKKDIFWRKDLDTLEKRLVLFDLLLPYFKIETIASILTISLIEQPTKIPNNNAFGIHPWKENFPWGWDKNFWVFKPNGYFICKEGTTKQPACYFSFEYLIHSCVFVGKVIEKRNIYDGEKYTKKWVGSYNKNLEIIFDNLYSKILKKIS
ncbi:MAG: hypothetical protein NZ608_07075 [candidate division WOR-3 bacterium]|nr:hypothetical protein [candidate division WOR-3 bacterium]